MPASSQSQSHLTKFTPDCGCGDAKHTPQSSSGPVSHGKHAGPPIGLWEKNLSQILPGGDLPQEPSGTGQNGQSSNISGNFEKPSSYCPVALSEVPPSKGDISWSYRSFGVFLIKMQVLGRCRSFSLTPWGVTFLRLGGERQ